MELRCLRCRVLPGDTDQVMDCVTEQCSSEATHVILLGCSALHVTEQWYCRQCALTVSLSWDTLTRYPGYSWPCRCTGMYLEIMGPRSWTE